VCGANFRAALMLKLLSESKGGGPLLRVFRAVKGWLRTSASTFGRTISLSVSLSLSMCVTKRRFFFFFPSRGFGLL